MRLECKETVASVRLTCKEYLPKEVSTDDTEPDGVLAILQLKSDYLSVSIAEATGQEAYPLKFVVSRAPHIFMGIPDDGHYPLCGLSLVNSRSEAFPQSSDGGLSLERWQARVEHELYSANQLVHMWSDGKECLDCELLEQLVSLGIPSAH